MGIDCSLHTHTHENPHSHGSPDNITTAAAAYAVKTVLTAFTRWHHGVPNRAGIRRPVSVLAVHANKVLMGGQRTPDGQADGRTNYYPALLSY